MSKDPMLISLVAFGISGGEGGGSLWVEKKVTITGAPLVAFSGGVDLSP